MKKILLLTISILCILTLTLGLSGCKKKAKPMAVVYSLDSSSFEGVAVVGETLQLNGLKLVGTNGTTVPVTQSMVSNIDTSTAGQKTFTVTHGSQKFVVSYTVKFRVVFVIEGVEYEQLVLFAEELVVPETPKIANKQFDRWSMQIPSALTENLRIEAIYKTLTSEREDVYTWTGEGVINTEGYIDGSDVSISVADENGNYVSTSYIGFNSSTGKISYTLGENDDNIIVTISGSSVTTGTKSWKIVRQSEPTLNIAGGQEATGVYLGADDSLHKINANSKVPLRYTITGNTNVSATEYSGYLIVTPLNAGVTELTIKATNATNELESVTLIHYVVVMPEKLMISNDIIEYGLEDIWTIGKDNSDRLQKLATMISSANVGEGFNENIYFVCDDSRVSISADGKITLNTYEESSAIVNVRAVFGFKGMTVESDPMQIRCVFNGVNVYSYAELWEHTNKANQPIVLQNNIKDDFGRNYTTMQSTYDLTYYKNTLGEGTDAYNAATQIKVLIQFKSDVYGNGYEINAHNATLGTLDGTGKPTGNTLFRGPINFVAISEDGGMISVKGQDNIVFGVYEGVTLNNIVLKSCDLTPNPDGKVDLTDLNFAGTTVEVLGDDVTIEYSRLMNGRTILRVFGDATDATKPIHVTVKNTMIKASREFSARIGSNRFENGNVTLPGDNSNSYNTKKNYNSMTAEQKAAYDEKFINTFVTFENVIFEDAGIFAIGVDTHFAGPLLANAKEYIQNNSIDVNVNVDAWHDLAKTSYGAKITLKDDVRFYTWQPLDNMDSSTLIENKFDKGNDLAGLKLDVKKLVEECSKKTDYASIVDTDANGQKYVHAAIAFFGGGKNYSVVENAITSSDLNYHLSEYSISLSDAGAGIYEKAAGTEPFYFMICNSKSSFNYKAQMDLAPDTKYAILRKK